jgi:sigma-B regulation protein RsbU (phosphoserine phosphatase)
VAVHYRTANRAGGDLYDFFPLSGGRLGVLVADVSGHGTPAAVLLAITHTLAHTYAGPLDRPGQFLGHLNQQLAARYTVTTGHFVTAVYGVFEPAADTLTYAVAGHPPPRLEVVRHWLPGPAAQRLPLGVSTKEQRYPEQTVPLPAGGAAAFVTDGVTDSTDQTGEPFGEGRLDAALAGGGPAAGMVRRALAALDTHTADAPADDDRTLLVVRRTTTSL